MTIKALYPTVRPTLNLDFAKTKALDPRITFTRASTATFVGADGLIKTAASGAARFDHNPTTGESLGLLVEEARTNYASQSLVAINATLISSNDTTYQPLQGGSVYKFSIGSSGLQFYVPLLNAPGYSSVGLADTLTFYLRSDSPVTITSDYNDTPASSGIYFSNGTTASYSTVITQSASVLGFTRYVINYSSLGVNGNNISRAQINVSGTSGTNFYVFGAQWESRASFPTSYIPTVASTVTRAADVASMTGTNFSSWYRNSSSTFALRGRFISKPTNYNTWGILSVTAGSADNNFRMRIGSSAGTQFAAKRFDNGTSYEFNLPGSVTAGSTYNYAVGYDDTGHAASSPLGFSSTTYPALPYQGATFLTFVPEAYGASHTIARLAYYPVRLPNAQLQALTR
jgi:hypothetical protein